MRKIDRQGAVKPRTKVRVELKQALQGWTVQMKGFHLSYSNDAGAGRRVLKKRHLSANFSRPQCARSLGGNDHPSRSLQDEINPISSFSFLNQDGAFLELDAIRLICH